jgi:hypothetical protein
VVVAVAGHFAITAVATDNHGNRTTSSAIQITLTQPFRTLIGTVDYSDTFTTNSIRPDGLYNDNSGGGYNVESNYNNPSATWTPTDIWSLNTPQSSTAPAVLNAAQGNPGASTGLCQVFVANLADTSFTYGLRSNYVVQVQAIMPSDRLDIGSFASAGAGILSTNSLSVFFRRSNGTVGLFNGVGPEVVVTNLLGQALHTSITILNNNATGGTINDDNWHTFAVIFKQGANRLQLYVDYILCADLDLTTFDGGHFQLYSNGAVAIGGIGGVFWMDNFEVGSVLESSSSSLAASHQGNNIVITWSGTGTLQSSPTVTGPWTNMPSAVSPYSTPANQNAQFYRLQIQ